MASIPHITRAGRDKAAKKRIKQLWEEGLFRFADHAVQRLRERGLDANDIQNVVRYGRVTHEGASGSPETPKRCVLEGKAVDGERMVCVVEIDGLIVLVTAYPRRGGGRGRE